MPQELMYLQQLLGRSGEGWLSVTLLVGLLLALIFRPNTIHNLFLFRAACWLLALSVVIPPMSNLMISLFGVSRSGAFRMGTSFSEAQLLVACTNTLGFIMQGASILCGLFSLLPPISRQSYANPVKHPLE
jgi:hypothetical protein